MVLIGTEAAGLVAKVIERAPARGRLSLIHGPHGVGKSTAIELAALDRAWVRRIDIPPGCEKPTPRTLYAELAQELGLEFGGRWSAGRVARAIAEYCQDQGLTLVLDQCDTLRNWELDALRYLCDRLGHLVMSGGPAMLMKVAAHAQLRTCCRLPFQMPAMSQAEATRVFGDRFSVDFLDRLVQLRGGLINDLVTVTEGCELIGRETRSLSGDDAETFCKQWLLGGWDVRTEAERMVA